MKIETKIYITLEQKDKNNIRIQLLEKGISQNEFAQQLGISRAYLSEILNGNRTLPSGLMQKMRNLGVEMQGEIK